MLQCIHINLLTILWSCRIPMLKYIRIFPVRNWWPLWHFILIPEAAYCFELRHRVRGWYDPGLIRDSMAFNSVEIIGPWCFSVVCTVSLISFVENFYFIYQFCINSPDFAQKETHGNCQPQHSFYFSRETWRIQPCSEDNWKGWGWRGKKKKKKMVT